MRLEKGRWHILRVEGADHSLGTWASEKSLLTYLLSYLLTYLLTDLLTYLLRHVG